MPAALPHYTDPDPDQIAFALEYIQDISYQVAKSLIDPADVGVMIEIAENVDLALETLVRVLGVQCPPTPRWLGSPEDPEPDTNIQRQLRVERHQYFRVLELFRNGATGEEIAAVIGEDDQP